MTYPENQYLDTLKDIIENGEEVENRTGVNTLRVLGVMHKYDFKHGFPLFTTKKVWFKGIVHELLWFLSGSTNIKYLVDNGVNIWNDDGYNHYKKTHHGRIFFSKEEWLHKVKTNSTFGDLGPVYGMQWRQWYGEYLNEELEYVDQIQNLIDSLKNNPSSRRHILTAWNPAQIEQMALPPCHVMSQYTISKGSLWCQMYQRSCDTPLGVPFNVASYALLTYMLAQVCGLKPGGLIWTGHDVHVYKNQIDGVKEQLKREPKPFPQLWLNPDVKNIDDFKFEDIKILNYECHEKIEMPLST